MHEDLKSLQPKTPVNRREFMVTTLAAGFALAVQPISAQTITTDVTGLVAGEVTIPKLKAGVAWYGRLVGEGNALQPKYPIDVIASLKALVLGLYGGDDQGIPMDTVEKMRAALKAAGSASEIIVYPKTPHGFHADYRPSYRKEQAGDGWNRLQQWFKKYVKA
ncbi:MAG: dienelactone hydrolase family protein [Acidobacteria bacterium]|nr:dienelactone hydrolase family protein [Acidobacteriota bacterium]MBI3656846.1 dienelactone hydrolase family protein [Acidobacteriota bacterium]